RRRSRHRGRESTRRADDARSRDDPPPESRPRAGTSARPARRRAGSPRGARRDLGGVLAAMTEGASYRSVDGLPITFDAGTLHITLARPDHRNAINDEMITAFVDALTRAATDDQVR